MPPIRLIRVALPVPLHDGFDYLWEGSELPPRVGTRIRVPFGRGTRVGVIVDHPPETGISPDKLRAAEASLDDEPVVGREMLTLLEWASSYYHHPIGEAVSHALPVLLRKGRTISAVEKRARAVGARRAVTPSEWPELTAAQLEVVDSISGAPPGFGAHLLFGVTGSGKTEVYLRLIRAELERSRQCLLLVPEIALTPQLVGTLEQRFGAELAVLHSGLSDGDRAAAWLRAHRGEAKLVVGTRSAVFASLPKLGLIVVDEEHDASFKQQTGFRYSARDLAVVRAQRLEIRIVLGSATPSLESIHNAKTGRYVLHTLDARIGSAGAPAYRIIDLNKHAEKKNLSTPLVSLIEQHLDAGNQVLLFLNRRGFAPTLFCPSCAAASECSRCDARMTVHARVGRLRCHHCGREQRLHWRCPVCGTERIGVGAGTQRVTEELEQLEPDETIARLDRDVALRKGELEKILAGVAAGKTRILVGTQMLTKGHDFPNVTLVGVLNADQGLFGVDFRSNERLAQTIVQVAGRAGRADKPGEVVIQTHFPSHPLLRCLLDEGYGAFAEAALAEREAAGWPPFSHIAALRAEATRRSPVFEFLDKARAHCESGRRPIALLGPAPEVMERKAGRYRAKLLLQSRARPALHDGLASLDEHVRQWPESRRVRWAIDVDPSEL